MSSAHRLERLVSLAAQWTGVSPEAVHPENVRRSALALVSRGMTWDALMAGAESGDGEVVEALRTAISIGETYFFRYPEQFSLVERLLRERPRESGDNTRFRAWSAGCATGEETYSIAALLHHLWPDAQPTPEVLGTDHLAASIDAARASSYRPWSVRASAPITYPLFLDGGMAIRAEVRAMAKFQIHNLLSPAPPGAFDLIFCRNVFIYYDPPAVAAVIDRLSNALSPAGLLVLGIADPVIRPPHLQPAGPPELRVYTRAVARQAAPLPKVHVRRPSAVLVPPRSPSIVPRAFDPVAAHLELLHAIERGQGRTAQVLVAEIRRQAPDYLAVRLEQALMHQRLGEKSAARVQVRELLELLRTAADDQILSGPEPLPVSYYRTAARALLEGGSR